MAHDRFLRTGTPKEIKEGLKRMKTNRILPDPIGAWKLITDNNKDADGNIKALTVCKIYNEFIKFIIQPLHPSQFIAWDKENNCPLEEPINYKWWLNRGENGCGEGWDKEQKKGFLQYQEAQSKVIFEGFVIDLDLIYDGVIYLRFDKFNIFFTKQHGKWVIQLGYKTISDLQNKVTLTDWKATELKLK